MTITTVMLVLGAGIGAGVWLIAHALRPPHVSLPTMLARLQPASPQPTGAEPFMSARPMPGTAAVEGRTERLLGLPSSRLAVRLGFQRLWRPSDLAVTGRRREQVAAQQTLWALTGLLLPVVLAAALAVIGSIQAGLLPMLLATWVGIVLALGGWLLPLLTLHQEATRARREVRHTLGALLDVTIIALAGGAGVEGALHDAAQSGTDWVSARIRRALTAARLRRQPPWIALAELGEELGVHELGELAASISLAGTEGAKVRASLAAKAASLRAHQHAQVEAEAHAATERMGLPLVGMLAAFLLLVGYPAVMTILNPT